MNIDGVQIGAGHPPWVCGEISGEHLGDKLTCVRLISALKDAGANAAKLQLFDVRRLADARGGYGKVLTEGLWKGRTLGSLYAETHTPREWFPDLFTYAKSIGITLFSSVFDEEGVDYLETLGCPAYKISSFEFANERLRGLAGSTGKPVILSTGMAHNEWPRAVGIPGARYPGGLALLHCVSAYPCPMEDANLGRMSKMADWVKREMWERSIVVGLSDHTLGTTAAIVATALGASIIEKHITLDRNNGGPDAAFSLEPAEFAKLVQDVRDAHASLGAGERPQSESIYRDLRHKGSQ